MMNILDVMIIAVFVYFVYTLLFANKEKFSSDLTAYNATIPSYDPPKDNIVFNDDYVLTNFTKIIYEFCMQLERDIHKSMQLMPDLQVPTEEEFAQASLQKRSKHVNDIIEKLNNKFNTKRTIIEMDKDYGIKEAYLKDHLVLLFKFNLTKDYKDYITNKENITKFGVATESKLTLYNTIMLAIAYKTNTIYQVRLFNVESIDVNAVTGTQELKDDTVYNINTPYENNLKLTLQEAEKEKDKYVTMRTKDKHGDCFIKEGVEDNIGFETDCKLNGGIWDSKCTTNEECPFYKANKTYENERGLCVKETGYCELPIGLTQLSYKKYEGQPKCHNCEDDKPCCESQENPDYAFIDDTVQRNKK